MIYKWIEKCCPICGKYFIDGSANRSKATCSKKCWYEYFSNYTHTSFDSKVAMRLRVFKGKGIEFTPEETEKIKAGLVAGVCEICGREVDITKLHIDHDHKTNQYRGIVCITCNVALGMIDDDLELLEKIRIYLSRLCL